MVELTNVVKVYDVSYEGTLYNVIVEGSGVSLVAHRVLKQGDVITDTELIDNVLEFFLDNIESE